MIFRFITFMIDKADEVGETWSANHFRALENSIKGMTGEAALATIRWHGEAHRDLMKEMNTDEQQVGRQVHWTKAINCEQIVDAVEGRITWE